MPIIDTWTGEKISQAQNAQQVKAIMGFGGVCVQDNSVDVLDMLRAFMEKAANESCGQCIPCRSGLKKLSVRLNALCNGESQADDVEYLSSIAHVVSAAARCDIGQTSPQALLDIIGKAPELLRAHKTIRGKYTALVTAPCINACPGHVQIPQYIENIRFRQFDQGLATVMARCPMPGTIGRVCERPCEKACKRGQNGAPLAIRHLKRFLFDQSNAQQQKNATTNATVTHSKSQKIAVVGAGPAGLSCAYYLSSMGFPVTVFEKQEASGGMAKYGIPDYRLPPHILAEEVARIQRLGCEIRYGVDVGKDISVTQLHDNGYKAIFIGAGAPFAPALGIEGEEAAPQGYVSGIHYLGETTKGKKIVHGSRLVVVGGGNVAMDCVRTARRHGFSDVQLLYRRTEKEMPADKNEISEAKEEGVNFHFLVAPLKLLHENGHVTGIVCQKMQLGDADASGRRRPVAIEGETLTIACDAVIHAIGQIVEVKYILQGLSEESETGMTPRHYLDADAFTGESPAFSHIFGGGDCVTGPKSLIAALAAGRRAALRIAEFVQDDDMTPSREELLEQSMQAMHFTYAEHELPPASAAPSMPVHTVPVEERLQSFVEVEQNSSEAEARREAERCLRCLRIIMIAE